MINMCQNDITAIILTKDEEQHIKRCIENLNRFCTKVYVVDSFSTDRTCQIAEECGAEVLQNKYVNQAQQFQWALENCFVNTEWTIRLDADEYLTDELIQEIQCKLEHLSPNITGVRFTRNVFFGGKILRFGNVRPVRILRLWRTGSVHMEQRWMDEHIVLNYGTEVVFKHRFIDDNLNGLTSWIRKHNNYSNREILTQIQTIYNFSIDESDASLMARNRNKSLYYRLPMFLRPMLYFVLRYIICLGFLDGIRGLIWLTLQAFWYRFLVDAKIYEMKKRLGSNPSREDVLEYISRFFEIDRKQIDLYMNKKSSDISSNELYS